MYRDDGDNNIDEITNFHKSRYKMFNYQLYNIVVMTLNDRRGVVRRIYSDLYIIMYYYH